MMRSRPSKRSAMSIPASGPPWRTTLAAASATASTTVSATSAATPWRSTKSRTRSRARRSRDASAGTEKRRIGKPVCEASWCIDLPRGRRGRSLARFSGTRESTAFPRPLGIRTDVLWGSFLCCRIRMLTTQLGRAHDGAPWSSGGRDVQIAVTRQGDDGRGRRARHARPARGARVRRGRGARDGDRHHLLDAPRRDHVVLERRLRASPGSRRSQTARRSPATPACSTGASRPSPTRPATATPSRICRAWPTPWARGRPRRASSTSAATASPTSWWRTTTPTP